MKKAREEYKNVTPATRSRMQAVRHFDTAPELQVRRILHAFGYRYRLHRKDLPGKPDIVLPRHGKIILVHGCFWHGHSRCKRAKLPTNNSDIWLAKINANKARDQKNISSLRKLGWHVLVMWECEVSDKTRTAVRLQKFMTGGPGAAKY